MRTILIFLSLFCHSSLFAQSAAQVARCFTSAYPKSTQQQGAYLVVNGKKLAITQSHAKTFTSQLNNAGIIDQISQPYLQKQLTAPPAFNDDPGRLRNGEFFDAMYGDNENHIRQNLTKVIWQPSNEKILFNTKNDADKALAHVGAELVKQKDLIPYVKKTMGSFNYRTIAGTKRKSAHAYGIAIDIAFPKPLYQYWKWSGCKPNQPCSYPQALLKDEKLHRIVQIFEKHGFIWGGKWHHFDSMHFEYRPELLHSHCQF